MTEEMDLVLAYKWTIYALFQSAVDVVIHLDDVNDNVPVFTRSEYYGSVDESGDTLSPRPVIMVSQPSPRPVIMVSQPSPRPVIMVSQPSS